MRVGKDERVPDHGKEAAMIRWVCFSLFVAFVAGCSARQESKSVEHASTTIQPDSPFSSSPDSAYEYVASLARALAEAREGTKRGLKSGTKTDDPGFDVMLALKLGKADFDRA